MNERVEKIRRKLKRQQIDAVLISQPENRFYLSGYTGGDHGIRESAGFLLIPQKGKPFLFTDGRYLLQAQEECPGWEVLDRPRGLMAQLRYWCLHHRPRSIAFESHYLLHSVFVDLDKLLGELGVKLMPLVGLVEPLREIKSEDELALVSEAVRLNESVFTIVYPQIKAGMSERKVAELIKNTMLRQGADGEAFPTMVASGPNGAKPHAVPGERLLAESEPIIIDMGVRKSGYCSDMSRTIVLGQPDRKTLEIIRTVRAAQQSALAMLKSGVAAAAVDKAARGVIAAAGYGEFFTHSLGHGVGLDVHEDPRVNYRSRRKLKAGMLITVEPGIYLPGWGGVRLEDMVLVEQNSCRVLNQDKTWMDV